MARGLRAGRGVWKEEVTAPPSGKGQVPAFAGTGGCLSFPAWRTQTPTPQVSGLAPAGLGRAQQPTSGSLGLVCLFCPWREDTRAFAKHRGPRARPPVRRSAIWPLPAARGPSLPHDRPRPPSSAPTGMLPALSPPRSPWGAPGCRYQSVALSSPQCCSELPSGSLLPRTSPTLAAVGPWQKPEDPHCGGRRAGGVGDWAAAQQRPRHPHSQLCGRRASGAGAMAPALPVSGASGVGVGRQEESTIAT